MPSTHRFISYLVIVFAIFSGGGSLLLLGIFLTTGPFNVIHLTLSEPKALLWDGFLSMLFFLQHSGMVRSSFRTWLSSTIPAHYLSAMYAIASGTVLTCVMLLWQPTQTILFEIQGLLRLPFHAAFLLGIAGFAWSAWALGGFDPFGRISILSHLADKKQASHLVVRGPYLWVRHPLYFFTLVLMWATPFLSSDRLLFNVLWTFWIVLGSYLEEKDLLAEFGESYRQYQKMVPMLLPWRGRSPKEHRRTGT